MARLTRGRLRKIVRAYRIKLGNHPGDHAARPKVARALRLLGRTEEAINEYMTLARQLAQEGDLLNAISACKSVLELDPRHTATQLELARLYALAPSQEAVAQPFQSGLYLSPGATPAPGTTAVSTPVPGRVASPLAGPGMGAPPRPPSEHPAGAPRTAAMGTPVATPIAPPGGTPQPAETLDPLESGRFDVRGRPDHPTTPPPPPQAPYLEQAPLLPRPEPDARPTVREPAQRRAAEAWPEPLGPSTVTLDMEEIEVIGPTPSRVKSPVVPGPLAPRAEVAVEVEAEADHTTDSRPAIELSDGDFDVIDQEPDSGEVIDTSKLTEGWDRIAKNLATEDDASLVQAVSSPSMPVLVRGQIGEEDLPEIPLFSALDRGAFVRLVEKLERHRLAPGEVLVHAGKGAEAIHVVAKGKLQASREADDGRSVLLAYLYPGDFLGEFTFLTGVPSPVCITAADESVVFRIDNAVMRDVIDECAEVEEVLWRFFVDRMTHSLLATSSLFQGLEPERQVEIGRRLRPVEVKRGTVVLREGEPAAGIYLVVSGALEITVRSGDERHKLATLTPGEFAGVRAAASGAPPITRGVAAEDSVLLVLPASDFRELMEEEPSVKIAVETVSGMRRLLTDALFHGETSYASGGLISF